MHYMAILLILSFLKNGKLEIIPRYQAVKTIKHMGYPAESHKIITSDGYILTIHRVPYGKNSNTNSKGLPVLYMHGLGSSTDHVLVAEENSTLFYLVEKGYDIWVGNSRGNKYSRKHIKLNPDRHPAFWKFSWHEIGIIDVPMIIDYILKKTNQNKLYYIGHSQGTTDFLVMASEKPEYNNKVKLSILLTPAGFFSHAIVPFGYLLSKFRKELFKLLPRILNTGLSTVSTMQFLHYLQLFSSGKFRQFDFGHRRNLIRYNSTLPPEYNLKNIIAPVALFYGKNDLLTTVEDVRILRDLLPNVVLDYLLPFTHLDFLWAKDLVKLVNEPIYDLFKKYENN